MSKQVFFDPQRKRWKRLRRIGNIVAVAITLVITIFAIGVLRIRPLPELLLTPQKHNLTPWKVAPVVPKRAQNLPRSAHRKTTRKPSEITLNSGEGLRAAEYVEWDPASYSSLKQHIKQIDLLFPEWLHVVTPDGTLTAYSIDNRPYPVIDGNVVHEVDREQKVARTIAAAGEDPTDVTEIFPLVNSFDPTKNAFAPNVGEFLSSSDARAHFLSQIDQFLARNPSYHGLTLDFEEIPSEAQPGYMALLSALYGNFHPRNLKLYVKTPVNQPDYDLKFISDHSDGIVLMNYDQHESIDSGPGPIAAQDWFLDNLKNVLKVVPKEKLICSVGNYGYDWTTSMPPPAPKHKGGKATTPELKTLGSEILSTQEAWQRATDADAQIELDPDSLNVHFAYDDNDAHVRHQVWYLDGVTVLNQMRAARALGIWRRLPCGGWAQRTTRSGRSGIRRCIPIR